MKINFNNAIQGLQKYLPNQTRVAIDLGSYTTRIALYKKGVVLKEPSFIGYNTRSKQYIFYGNEAKDIYGKAPDFIKVIKPVNNGIISDFDAVIYLLSEFINKSVKLYYSNNIIKPSMKVFTAIPTSATEVEQRALTESLSKVGFCNVYLVEKPIALALNVNPTILSKKPIFILDVGAGVVEMAVIIMGGILCSKTINNAGENMDKMLINYLRLKYGLIIGPLSAEYIKINLFDINDTKKTSLIRGKSLENGLPKSVKVTSFDVKEALAPVINQVIDYIKEFIEIIPPETVDNIMKSGIQLSGGVANIQGLANYFAKELKLPVTTVSKPEDATIHGLINLMENEEKYKDYFIKS